MDSKFSIVRLPDPCNDKNIIYNIQATYVEKLSIKHESGWGIKKYLKFKDVTSIDGEFLSKVTFCNDNSFTGVIDLRAGERYTIFCKMPFNGLINWALEFHGMNTNKIFTFQEHSQKNLRVNKAKNLREKSRRKKNKLKMLFGFAKD